MRKKAIVKAVLVDFYGNACGFSKPLTDAELAGDVPINIEITDYINLETAEVDFATAAGVIKTASIDFSTRQAFPGYVVTLTPGKQR